MTQSKRAAFSPSSVVAERVKEVRTMRRWAAADLAERCADLGMPELNRSVIANIESGRRRDVSVDELLVFARALDVAPVHLLVPIDAEAKDRYAITPSTPHPIGPAREWIRGKFADSFVNQRIYFSQVPEEEFVVPEPPSGDAAAVQGERIEAHRKIVRQLTPKDKG